MQSLWHKAFGNHGKRKITCRLFNIIFVFSHYFYPLNYFLNCHLFFYDSSYIAHELWIEKLDADLTIVEYRIYDNAPDVHIYETALPCQPSGHVLLLM